MYGICAMVNGRESWYIGNANWSFNPMEAVKFWSCGHAEEWTEKNNPTLRKSFYNGETFVCPLPNIRAGIFQAGM